MIKLREHFTVIFYIATYLLFIQFGIENICCTSGNDRGWKRLRSIQECIALNSKRLIIYRQLVAPKSCTNIHFTCVI